MSVVDRLLRLPNGLCTMATLTGGSGSGPPVVLLHPWVESRRAFCRLTPLLRPARTVALDLRGHGDADKTPEGHGLADLADDVVQALDLLGIGRAVLVGASSGGYVAQQVAATAPARVAGLVLAGAPGDLRGRVPFADEVEALTDPVDPAWVAAFVARFASPLVPPSYVDLVVAEARRLPAAVWRASLAGLTGSPPPTTVGRIEAPTLVVSGDRDALLPRSATEALVAAIPGATWIEYANTGHAVLWERPGLLAADIAAFLEAEAPVATRR